MVGPRWTDFGFEGFGCKTWWPTSVEHCMHLSIAVSRETPLGFAIRPEGFYNLTNAGTWCYMAYRQRM